MQAEFLPEFFELPALMLIDDAVSQQPLCVQIIGLLATANVLREARGQDRCRQRDHADAEQADHAAEYLAHCRNGNDVPVTDRGQRYDRPPHRRRDAAERLGLQFMLENVDTGGGHDEQDQQDHKSRQDRLGFFLDHVKKGAEGRGVTRELEQAQKTQTTQEAQVDRDVQAQVERQYGDQVDQRQLRQHVPDASLGRRRIRSRLEVHAAPHTCEVLDRKNRDGENLDVPEDTLVAQVDPVDRLENDRNHIQRDERDEQQVENAARLVRLIAELEQLGGAFA